MNGIEKKTMMTRMSMSSQPVGMAAARIQPMLDFVVNKSSTYGGAGASCDPNEEFNVCTVVDVTVVNDSTNVVVVVVVLEIESSDDDDKFCLILETSLLSMPDDGDGLILDLYSALSQS